GDRTLDEDAAVRSTLVGNGVELADKGSAGGGQPGRDGALTGREDAHPEHSGVQDGVVEACAPLNTEQDEWWIQRDGGEGVRGHRVVMPCGVGGDDDDAGRIPAQRPLEASDVDLHVRPSSLWSLSHADDGEVDGAAQCGVGAQSGDL